MSTQSTPATATEQPDHETVWVRDASGNLKPKQLRSAEVYKLYPLKTAEVVSKKTKLRIVQAGEWLHDWKPAQSLINGLFRRKYVYSLTAPAGSGKTAVALTIAAHVAEGRDLGDHVTTDGRVLYLAGENDGDVMERLHMMAETMQFDLASLPLDFLPFVGGMDDIKATIRATGHEYSLVIVDTSQAYFSGDDFNDNRAAKDWAQELRTLADDLPGGPTVVVLSHPPKSADRGPYVHSAAAPSGTKLMATRTWTDMTTLCC
ncbi:AAA family ATPase [Ensifer sp. Root278]|uniref:AAA family ATPase n=1 Tax=Ensifer sp. Root278 TaxID=1736509 RepID=UPI00070B7039|nr:AAA family ATPase [Ensifer sp. Root278]KRD71815.1 hypothetical protein ASE60_24770 [Ensifer sp. Root278]